MVLTFERNRGERERLSDIFIVIMSFRRRVALLACQLPELLFCFYRGHGIIGNSASVPLKPFSAKKEKKEEKHIGTVLIFNTAVQNLPHVLAVFQI